MVAPIRGNHLKEKIMAITNDPGIYMLRNKLNGATYVGAGKRARARVMSQIRSLMRGDNTNELLQADWSRLGAEAFEVCCVQVLMEELNRPGNRGGHLV